MRTLEQRMSKRMPDDSHLRMVERLVRSNGSKIKRYLRQKLGSVDDIKDATQEIWERLLRLPKESIKDEVKALNGIMRNVMREFVRAHARRKKRTALPTAPGADDDADTHTDSEDPTAQLSSEQPSLEDAEDERRGKQLLDAAIGNLRVPHRAVFLRRAHDRFSVADTAKACGVSEAMAERLYREAREQILDFITSRKKDFL
jgi:RNA polymerase sigma factor (sigma-70 family)